VSRRGLIIGGPAASEAFDLLVGGELLEGLSKKCPELICCKRVTLTVMLGGDCICRRADAGFHSTTFVMRSVTDGAGGAREDHE
jgi:hypothetical protein